MLLSGIVLAASLTGALANTQPLPDIRAALERSHFSYPLNRDEVTLHNLGEIGAGHRRYRIVGYVWSESRNHDAHTRGGGALHGAQRLLVFERMGESLRYLGQYGVSAAPVAIKGKKVLFDAPPETGNEIVFGPDGPPREAWIDGENPVFDTSP